MIIEREIIKVGNTKNVCVITADCLIYQVHQTKEGYINHIDRTDCCTKYGRPSSLYMVPVVVVGEKKVKFLYLNGNIYKKLQEALENSDDGRFPIGVKCTTNGSKVEIIFTICIDDSTNICDEVRSSSEELMVLLKKYSDIKHIEKITPGAVYFNDIP